MKHLRFRDLEDDQPDVTAQVRQLIDDSADQVRRKSKKSSGVCLMILLSLPTILSCRDPDHEDRLPACFMVASGGVLFEGYGRERARV